jgi:hypothetical protein
MNTSNLTAKATLAFALTIATSSTGFTDEAQVHHHGAGASSSSAADHAPIGVMGDHTHGAGEWMASYRYMFMDMDGLRDGTTSVSAQQVLDNYMVTPLEMSMEMHMVGFMYAPSDDLTLMAMLPVVEKAMDHRTRMGREFTTETSGFGDLKLAALYDIWQSGNHQVHINAGVSLPTGGIDEEDDTPAGRSVLPYPMQLGSGTYDLMPGLTYLGHAQETGWGAQIQGTYRIDENDNDYALGDRYDMSAWVSRSFCTWMSGSLRLVHADWSNIDGADPSLNPQMVPTADPNLRGGNRTELGFGVNLFAAEGFAKGHRFAAEVLWPIREELNGPQLETDLSVVVGWQKAF